MAGKFLRGAFVQFIETVLIPVPSVVIFQFNPEQIVHTWSPADTVGDKDNPLAVSGAPGEKFSFTLAMDSNDMIADGSSIAQGMAKSSGLYSRLAALEMLMHPVTGVKGLLGSISISSTISIGREEDKTVPTGELPTVLFVWGPGRILPVTVTSLAITETLYDSVLLHPTHAEASVELQVLTPRELLDVNGPLAGVARVAYTYSRGLRETLAVANLANATESVIGMIPT